MVGWLIGLPVLAITLGYMSEVALRHTVTRQRDEARREAARLREKLHAAREAQAAWRAWARTVQVARYPGWESAAGAMMRWTEATEDDTDGDDGRGGQHGPD